MNSRLMQYATIIVMVTCIGSVITHRQTASDTTQQSRALSSEQGQSIVFDWQSVLLAMPQYRKPEQPFIEAPVSSTKTVSIGDSRLVAIITQAPKTVAVILPERNQSDPVNYREGEGWLDKWIIASIEADAVIWQHIETEEIYKQYLFE